MFTWVSQVIRGPTFKNYCIVLFCNLLYIVTPNGKVAALKAEATLLLENMLCHLWKHSDLFIKEHFSLLNVQLLCYYILHTVVLGI